MGTISEQTSLADVSSHAESESVPIYDFPNSNVLLQDFETVSHQTKRRRNSILNFPSLPPAKRRNSTVLLNLNSDPNSEILFENPPESPALNTEELNSPQYLEIIKELTNFEKEEAASIQTNFPIRRRWRGLAPSPQHLLLDGTIFLPQIMARDNREIINVDEIGGPPGNLFKSNQYIDQGSQYNYLPNFVNNNFGQEISTLEICSEEYVKELLGSIVSSTSIPSNSSSTNVFSNHVPSKNEAPFGNNAKEFRWKHQTDLLKTKFAKGKNSNRGNGQNIASNMSVKSYITKWKL